jgi:hypothetical protein
MATSITCPACGRSARYDTPRPGAVIRCACGTCFELDAGGKSRALPIPEPAAPEAGPVAAVLCLLAALEGLFLRMISGVGTFLGQSLPLWLGRQLISLARIAVAAVRVLLVFSAWGCLCFLPLLLLHRLGGLPMLIAVAWTALALSGSVWGAVYARRVRLRLWRRRQARIPAAVAVPVAEVAG